MRTVVNSIKIPNRFVHACIGWEGGMDCMLRAVTSTGNLTTGTHCPTVCDGCDEKWYLQIWRELTFDLSQAVRISDGEYSDSPFHADALVLAEFEAWVDCIIERLEGEYDLADWAG
jgi:hypothetical protein